LLISGRKEYPAEEMIDVNQLYARR
jgi:hypothetical protein